MKRVFAILLILSAFASAASGQENPKAAEAATVICGNARFTVLTPQLIRMEWCQDGKFEDRASLTFVNRNLDVPQFKLSRTGKGVTIKTDKVTLRYTGNGSKFDESNLSVQFTLNGRKISWKPGAADSANLMGTAWTLDRAIGRKLREGTVLEKGILSRDGWTIVDDSERHLFQPDDSQWGSWVTCRPAGERQDLYIFAYGHEYRKAMEDYSKVAGRAPMPPKYTFGYWWSRYWQYSDSELRDLVAKLRSLSIPLDVLIIDMDWHDIRTLCQDNPPRDAVGQRIGWTGYTWQKDLFPSPANFLEWTNREQLPVALNLHPASGIEPFESVYEDFAKDYGWDKPGENIPYRMDEEKWADSYFKTIIAPMEKMGVDFWWLDWQQWRNSKDLPGLSNTFWLNHVFYNHARIANPDVRPFLYHRWGGLGSHRYPIAFSGDHYSLWSSLDYQPEFTATSANVNYGYWGHDVGGHMFIDNNKEHTNPEQYTRWIQYGVFTPIYKIHPTKHPNIERYFWLFPDQMFTMIKALDLRYQLVPYIYNAARRNYDTGIAMCHPLYYDYPENGNAYKYTREYLFGDDILATCISQPMDTLTRLSTIDMWFPEGDDWFDMASGSMHKGGSEKLLSYTLNEAPWYVKAGAILPMNPSGIKSLKRDCDTLLLTFIPGGDGSLSYYEDDGISQKYDTEYSITKVSQARSSNSIVAKVSPREGSWQNAPKTRSYELCFPASPVPSCVKVNGAVLEYKRFPEGACWTYDGYTLAPVISLQNIPVEESLLVELEFSEADMARQPDLYGLTGLFGRCRDISEEYKIKQGIKDRYKMLPVEYLAISQCPNYIMENPFGLFGFVDALKKSIPAYDKELDTDPLISEEFKTILRAQIIGNNK